MIKTHTVKLFIVLSTFFVTTEIFSLRSEIIPAFHKTKNEPKTNHDFWGIDPPDGYTKDTSSAPVITEFKDQSGYLSVNIYNHFKKRIQNAVVYQKGWLFERTVITNENIVSWIFRFEKNGEKYKLEALYPEKYHSQAVSEISSTVNSFYPSAQLKWVPGIIQFYTYRDQEAVSDINRKFYFNGIVFKNHIAETDIKALRSLIKREKAILFQYKEANHKAMVRLYRQIYKDAYVRLRKFADSLDSIFKRQKMNKLEIFNFIYKGILDLPTKTLNGSEIILSPVDVLVSGTGDCDSKALLCHLLLDHFDIYSEILISYRFKHAAVGIPVDFFPDFLKHELPVFMTGLCDKPLVYTELLQEKPRQDYADLSAWKLIRIRISEY